MKRLPLFLIVSFFLAGSSFSQELSNEEQLNEVIINSTRIDLPFSENSRTITVISSETIKQSTATNVADLLQSIS